MIGEHQVNDDDIREALAPYRLVQASDRLRAAVTDPSTPSLVSQSHSRIAFWGVAAVTIVALVVVSSLWITGSRSNSFEPVDGPLDISAAEGIVIAGASTVETGELFDAANHDRLRALFAEHGAELVVNERPVAMEADGRVFSVMVPAGMADEGDDSGLIHLAAGGRVEVDVGRGDPTADVAGLTLYEVFPAIEEAVDRDDPIATGLALGQLGFRVQWVLIEAPGRGHDVGHPPPGTVVISVLGPDGQWTDIDPTLDTLMVEVAAPAVAEELDH